MQQNENRHDEEEPAAPIVEWYSWMPDAMASIALRYVKNSRCYPDLKSITDDVKPNQKRFPKISFMVTALVIQSSGWQSYPKFKFDGPFTSTEADAGETEGRLLALLLPLSSLYGPITPLECARVASQGRPGSRVLTQNSAGHCT